MATGKKSAAKAPKGKKAAPKKPAPKKAAPKPKPAPKKAKPAPKKVAPKKAAPKPAPKPAPKKAAPAPKPVKAAPPPKAAPKPAPVKAAPAPAPKAAPVKPAPAAPKAAAAPKVVKEAPAAKAAAAPPAKAAKAAAPVPTPAAPGAPAAKAAAASKTPKKKAIPTTSLAATPMFRPLHEPAPPPAPPPPPAKPGHVDHQVLSAISYGLFAAVNKSFGFAGRNVVKNAALRMLEYGYKRGWLPPKSKEPIRALNEFFGRLEAMGYAEKIHIAKRGDSYALEVAGLADFDAVHSLREMHYPLLPVFLGEMLEAIVDQYFHLKVTVEPLEMQDQKRGFNIPFSLHERPQEQMAPSAISYSRVDDYEE